MMIIAVNMLEKQKWTLSVCVWSKREEEEEEEEEEEN